jgi:hypothetical protein
MIRHDSILRSLPLAALVAVTVAISGCHSAAERSAEPIVEKNAEARGGLKAWRAVTSMTMSGKLDAGKPRDPVKLAASYLKPRTQAKADARKALAQPRAAEEVKPVQLPFVMELKRPRMTRVEIRFRDQTAVQVYDGSQGWKVRPFLGRHEVEPFTADELRIASQQTDLDGPLIDYAKKGNKVELEGTEPVDGRDAYRLKITSREGQVRHVWVDATTYLDVKVDGTRRMDGKPRPVWTTYRDFRSVNGLMVPHVMETTVEGVAGSEKIVLDRVALNPPLDDDRFARPN